MMNEMMISYNKEINENGKGNSLSWRVYTTKRQP